MRFNAKKCYILSINNKCKHLYTLDNTTLKQVTTNPYLGITFSNDLKWSHHIANTTSKANSFRPGVFYTLGLLRRNLKFCPKESRWTAYLAMIRLTLEYGALVWDPHLVKDIKCLERVQKRGVRFITGDYHTRTPGSITEMLASTTTLRERKRHLRLAFLFKIIQGKVPAIAPVDFLKPKPARRKGNTIQRSCHNQHHHKSSTSQIKIIHCSTLYHRRVLLLFLCSNNPGMEPSRRRPNIIK